jgi:hypothetical protein
MATTAIDNTDQEVTFSLTEGGPGSSVMRRLHLVHPELGKGSVRSALYLAVLTWGPLFAFCLIEGLAFGGVKIPFFYDIAVHVRFLVAVPILVLADISIGTRLRQVVKHFVAAHLIRENEKAKFDDALIDALRSRDSHFAELTILILAYVATYNAVEGSFQGTTWYRFGSGQELTLVGCWYALVSLPIFQFLIFRWIYRMMVWSSFLRKISRLDLLLTPTHPDAAGGLAFLGTGLVPCGVVLFALSSVVSGAIATRILFIGGRLEEYQWSYVALFAVGLLVFAGPLLIFMPKLLVLKQRGLLEYGILGSEYTQAFHQKWVQRITPIGEVLLGSGDIQSLADLNNSFEVIQKIRILPLQPRDFIAMVLPGLIPALPLAATVMPLGEILSRLLKLVL